MATVNLPFPLPGSGPLVGPQNQLFSATATDVNRRDDLLPGCVAIQFRITNTWNGQQYITVVNDIATTISGVVVEGIGSLGGLCPVATFIADPTTYLASGTQTTLQNAARAPGVKSATVNMEGATSNACVINTLAVNTGDPASVSAALDMWLYLIPSLGTDPVSGYARATNIAQVSGSSVVAVDDHGNSVDLTQYAYILLDNAIPTWLNGYNPNPGGPLTVQATITGQLSYTENATVAGSGTVKTKIVPHQEFSAHATLIQIGSGTYAESTASEVIPYGMSGYIYNIESVLQFEGSYTIQENEITDMCPMGSCLNLTGSANADWAGMNAPVQSIHYDIAKGETVINFGVAAHLGAKDMVELNRANRGIRPFYFIGGAVANTPGAASTAPVSNAQRAPGKGTDQNSVTITHQNLADSQAYA